MVTGVDSTRLRLLSKPYSHRTGLWPMVIALSIGFLFSLAWLAAGLWMITQPGAEYIAWGGLILLSTGCYLFYLGMATYKIWTDSRLQYCLELTETEAILSVVDKDGKKKSTQMVLLADVRYGEYYPYTDSACLVLHAPYTKMEIPLWPLGAQSQDALDFLEGRGVHIINVQSDERIPG